MRLPTILPTCIALRPVQAHIRGLEEEVKVLRNLSHQNIVVRDTWGTPEGHLRDRPEVFFSHGSRWGAEVSGYGSRRGRFEHFPGIRSRRLDRITHQQVWVLHREGEVLLPAYSKFENSRTPIPSIPQQATASIPPALHFPRGCRSQPPRKSRILILSICNPPNAPKSSSHDSTTNTTCLPSDRILAGDQIVHPPAPPRSPVPPRQRHHAPRHQGTAPSLPLTTQSSCRA